MIEITSIIHIDQNITVFDFEDKNILNCFYAGLPLFSQRALRSSEIYVGSSSLKVGKPPPFQSHFKLVQVGVFFSLTVLLVVCSMSSPLSPTSLDSHSPARQNF